jgi:hypothetical protein
MNWGAHKADVRIAAKNSVTMRAALRASINAQTIYEAYQETQPFVTDNNTQDRTRARAWAMLNVKIDPEPIKAALIKIYTDGFLLGLDASEEAFNKAEKEFNKAALTKANEYIDWANWKPGNRAAALLFRPTGAFKEILDNAGIVSKTIAKAGYDRIGTALSDSIAAGFSPGRAAKIIAAKIGDPARALTIAITEQNRAVSMATMQNYQRFGLEKMEWSGAMPCEICAKNEGQVVAIGQPFNSGHTQPPAHPNCRCALLPPPFDDKFYAEENNSGLDLMPKPPQSITSESGVIKTMNQQRNAGYIATKSQVESIAEYTSGSGTYGEVNLYLREGEWDRYIGAARKAKYEKIIADLDDVIKKAPPLEEPLLTYRGIWGQEQVQLFTSLKPGQTITDLGFVSTSLNETVAKTFARYEKANGGIILEIINPAKTRGVFPLAQRAEIIPKYVSAVSENEWLLPRGTTLEVIKVEGRKVTVMVK